MYESEGGIFLFNLCSLNRQSFWQAGKKKKTKKPQLLKKKLVENPLNTFFLLKPFGFNQIK